MDERERKHPSYYVKKYHLDENDSAKVSMSEASLEKPMEKPEGPLFVSIDAFKTMMGDIEEIKNRVKSTDGILTHLNEIKNSKDRELEKWKASLEDMQRKLNYVDKVVFKEA